MSLTETAQQVRRRDLRIPLAAVLIVLALAAPFIGSRYITHSLIIALIFMLPAHGLNLLVGYTGLLSLAQAAFFGIGAYTAGLLAVTYGTPFYVNLIAAGAVSGALALPLGIPALRLRSTSFVMCTLGFVIIGQAIAKNWISLTRGDMGLSGIPKPYFELGPAVVHGVRHDELLLSRPDHRGPRHLRRLGDRPLARRAQHGGDP